jgi:uncharacterized protein
MNEAEILNETYNFAEKYYSKDDIHGFPHILRILKIVEHLAEVENADLFVVKMATLLHDIGRLSAEVAYDDIMFLKIKRDLNHAELSAVISEQFFRRNFSLKSEIVEQILHCIRAHSFSNKTPPETIEAKILSDADKLDALGAIGLYRTIGYQVKHGTGLDGVINHLNEKILQLKEDLFLTSAKKIAQERNKLIESFMKEIKEELQ